MEKLYRTTKFEASKPGVKWGPRPQRHPPPLPDLLVDSFDLDFRALWFVRNRSVSDGSKISTGRAPKLQHGAPTYDLTKLSEKLHEIENIFGELEAHAL